MDHQQRSNRPASALQRQLANLKLVSRLLSHELHAQGGAKSITLSREEVLEIQTTLELFIEDVARRQGGLTPGHPALAGNGQNEPRLVPTRN